MHSTNTGVRSQPSQCAISSSAFAPEGGLVVDPFLGSGVSALEALRLRRRFTGVDINPIAVRIARLIVSPPSLYTVEEAFARLSAFAKDAILESYATTKRIPATHYIWRNGIIERVWLMNGKSHSRMELVPSEHDFALAERFASYEPQRLPEPRFLTNSRINSSASLTLKDIFTGRALRNIELLLAAIDSLPEAMQEPMRLSLTAAIGQMSKMVFVITGRGKKSGAISGRMEVGSWVIGYWRPVHHFEINVWNCFEHRVRKLIKAIAESEMMRIDAKLGTIASVCNSEADYALLCGDTLQLLPELPDKAADLIITDPLHGDRIPYLELSEIWNVILGERPSFESEIVVSNAKKRNKNISDYNRAMSQFLKIASHKLNENGFLVLFFNARTKESWDFLRNFASSASALGITYCGCFPLVYSATSVVQDNRDGALRTDYGLVFCRSTVAVHSLASIPGWMPNLPTPEELSCR